MVREQSKLTGLEVEILKEGKILFLELGLIYM